MIFISPGGPRPQRERARRRLSDSMAVGLRGRRRVRLKGVAPESARGSARKTQPGDTGAVPPPLKEGPPNSGRFVPQRTLSKRSAPKGSGGWDARAPHYSRPATPKPVRAKAGQGKEAEDDGERGATIIVSRRCRQRPTPLYVKNASAPSEHASQGAAEGGAPPKRGARRASWA